MELSESVTRGAQALAKKKKQRERERDREREKEKGWKPVPKGQGKHVPFSADDLA